MAGDMMSLMRGLAKLSQAVVETQSNTLRSGSGESAGFLESHVHRLFTLSTIRSYI